MCGPTNNSLYDTLKRRRHSEIYVECGEKEYVAKTTEWTPERRRVPQILADAGFNEDLPGSDQVAKAREILERHLKQNPRDADAWNFYLANFWRFSFAACGCPFGMRTFTAPLRDAIRSACKNCPHDERLLAWNEALRTNSEPPTFANPEKYRLSDEWKYEFTLTRKELDALY